MKVKLTPLKLNNISSVVLQVQICIHTVMYSSESVPEPKTTGMNWLKFGDSLIYLWPNWFPCWQKLVQLKTIYL